MSSSLQQFPHLEQFLVARLPFPGLVAWSARLPDRTLASQCCVQWLTDSRSEQVLTRLALAADGLRYHQLEPVRLCWSFEQMRFHLALGADETCLALIVSNSEELSLTALEGVLDDFTRLGA